MGTKAFYFFTPFSILTSAKIITWQRGTQQSNNEVPSHRTGYSLHRTHWYCSLKIRQERASRDCMARRGAGYQKKHASHDWIAREDVRVGYQQERERADRRLIARGQGFGPTNGKRKTPDPQLNA